MKTFEETLTFIETKAAEHAADDSDWDYELIELEAFTAIIEFSLSEGFSVTCCDLAAFVKKANGTEEDEDDDDDNEKNLCWRMNEICEEMNALQESGEIPEQTQQLYTFWQRKFWPDDDAEQS
ncbi:hypothetical protein [Methylovulum sp.]|uniref:hypothetical protein n=1 Tax=Methylovulum sp. TaxID=1916980 RepID=UPI002630A465|nr:hypothetical protein [Methylovulum sp.]MDD5124336.1 hypothetical protein [Methylovulum sp.]